MTRVVPAAGGEVTADFLESLHETALMFWYWPDVSVPRFWCPGGFLTALGYRSWTDTPSVDDFLLYVHPDDRKLVADRIRRRAHDTSPHNQSYEADFRLRLPDGRYVWTRATMAVAPGTSGKPSRVVGVTQVIGETRLLDEARRGQPIDPLYAVMNEMGRPVILMNADGTISQANRAAARAAGHEELPEGTPCPFMHAPNQSAPEATVIANAISLRTRQQIELERFGRIWDIHLIPVPNASGLVTQVLLLAADVTVAKTLERDRLAAERALMQTLVREVHHRIKNHLQGLVALMRMNLGQGLTTTELVARAIVQIRSIAIVHGLLSRHPAENIDLAVVLREMVRMLEQDRPDGLLFNLKIEADAAIDLDPEDAVPIALAIGELITNAAKHTRNTEGARVEVTLRNADSGNAELIVLNCPASLPPGFSLQACRGTHRGLDLAQSLLPSHNTHLDVFECNEGVVAQLRLRRAAAGATTPAVV